MTLKTVASGGVCVAPYTCKSGVCTVYVKLDTSRLVAATSPNFEILTASVRADNKILHNASDVIMAGVAGVYTLKASPDDVSKPISCRGEAIRVLGKQIEVIVKNISDSTLVVDILFVEGEPKTSFSALESFTSFFTGNNEPALVRPLYTKAVKIFPNLSPGDIDYRLLVKPITLSGGITVADPRPIDFGERLPLASYTFGLQVDTSNIGVAGMSLSAEWEYYK